MVHRHCLEKWRRTSDKEDAAYRCGECKDEYRDALSLELLSARLQAERAYGEGTPFTLYTLAYELQAQGKFDEAEPLYRELLEMSRETLGDRHPDTLECMNNLGLLLRDKGDFTAAEPLLREALEVLRETLGARDPSTGPGPRLASLRAHDGPTRTTRRLRPAAPGRTRTSGQPRMEPD